MYFTNIPKNISVILQKISTHQENRLRWRKAKNTVPHDDVLIERNISNFISSLLFKVTNCRGKCQRVVARELVPIGGLNK